MGRWTFRAGASRAPAPRSLMAILVVAAVLAGCSKPEPTAVPLQETTSSVAAASVEAPEKAQATACDMVTESEMSTILGGAVVAKNNDHSNGKTECIYSAATGVAPYAELAVEWGSGEGAMMGAALVNQQEPGIASPYDGIGDQAMAVGPTLMIRTGEDLMTIVFSGVEDVPAKAKQVFETAKARM